MGYLLTILGLLLALIALPWLKRPVEEAARSLRSRYRLWRGMGNDPLADVKAIRDGKRDSVQEDFLVCDWKHKVLIRGDETTESEIDCELVNMSDGHIGYILFPMYFEYPPEELKGWSRVGRTEGQINTPLWDREEGCGKFRIVFPTPIGPRESVRVRWGYPTPPMYFEGREWWEWYFARPHSLFRLTIEFSADWLVSNATGVFVDSEVQPSQPSLKGNVLKWVLKGPLTGRKCRVEFDLKKAKAEEGRCT